MIHIFMMYHLFIAGDRSLANPGFAEISRFDQCPQKETPFLHRTEVGEEVKKGLLDEILSNIFDLLVQLEWIVGNVALDALFCFVFPGKY